MYHKKIGIHMRAALVSGDTAEGALLELENSGMRPLAVPEIAYARAYSVFSSRTKPRQAGEIWHHSITSPGLMIGRKDGRGVLLISHRENSLWYPCTFREGRRPYLDGIGAVHVDAEDFERQLEAVWNGVYEHDLEELNAMYSNRIVTLPLNSPEKITRHPILASLFAGEELAADYMAALLKFGYTKFCLHLPQATEDLPAGYLFLMEGLHRKRDYTIWTDAHPEKGTAFLGIRRS